MTKRRRPWARIALAVLGVVGVWQLMAELVEPHFLLRFRPGSAPLEVTTIRGTMLRLHTDTRPHIGKIAGLQKGLVWVRDGRALVQEGYGFGCPIIEIDGRAYLSRHSETEIAYQGDVTRLIKHYVIDTVDTPIRFMRRKYRAVPSLGVVTYRYDVRPDGVIDVEVDFSQLERDWDVAYLMNEQGAIHFTEYRDSNGTSLGTGDIGIWELANPSLRFACFDSDDSRLSFCVEPLEPSILRYGRERYNQYNWRGFYYLSWSGLDLEVSGPRSDYHYRIVLEAR